MKALYLSCLKDALKTHNKDGSLSIHAYTVMDNHFHNLMNFTAGSQKVSNFLRQAHSLFGMRYNKRHSRSGKVAEGRPKTPLIENIEHQMRVHFYIEANPIRAGMCTFNQLQNYIHSSYRFYALGIKDEFTELLTIPEWYLALGANALERQSRYRTLFLEYLNLNIKTSEYFSYFIGSPIWKLSRENFVKVMTKSKNQESNSDPPD